MSNLKLYPVFRKYGLLANALATAAADTYLKGEPLLQLKPFRDEGIKNDDIRMAMSGLDSAGIIRFDFIPFDIENYACLQIKGFSMDAGLTESNQADQASLPLAETYGIGKKDHRIGHAIYRVHVYEGEIEEGQPVDYRMDITRFTIHPDSLEQEINHGFSVFRQIINDEPFPTAEAAWVSWNEFVENLTPEIPGEGPVRDIYRSPDNIHALVFQHTEGSFLHSEIWRKDPSEDWVQVAKGSSYDEDTAYGEWEQALDDLFPGEVWTNKAPETTEVPNNVALLGDSYDFKVTVNDIEFTCHFAKASKMDRVDLEWVVDDKKQKDKILIRTNRPTTTNQVETMTKTHIQEKAS